MMPGGDPPEGAFAEALAALPPGARVDGGVNCVGEALHFPPRAAWLWVPLAAAPGCYRLELEAHGASGFRAEMMAEPAPVALPLLHDGRRYVLDVALEAPVAWLRLLPVEAGTVRFTAFRFAVRPPWRSLLPDWQVGPVRLPVRQGTPEPVAPVPPTPPGWDPRVSIDAAEALTLTGTMVDSGAFGALRLTFAGPLPAGQHLVEAAFRDADGAPAWVAPRLYADAPPPNAKPLAHFRKRAGARYVARVRLEAPARHLVLVPRQERGKVFVEGLAVRRLGPPALALSLLSEGWRLFGHRLLAPLERLVGPDPDADGRVAAVLRLATRNDLRYRRSRGRGEGETLRRLLDGPLRNAGEIVVAIGPGTEAARARTRASIEACGDGAWREAGEGEAADLEVAAGSRLVPHALAVARRAAVPAPLSTDRLTLGLRSAPHFAAGAAPLVLAHRAGAALPRPVAVAQGGAGPGSTVTVVTATRDAPDHLSRFLASWRATRPAAADLVLVDNGSTDPAALTLLAEAATDAAVKVVADDRPFNFGALNNLGASLAGGDILIFANNDIEFRYGGWAEALVRALHVEGTGVAGGLLDYPDGRVQHAGIVLAGEARVRHLERFSPAREVGYFGRRRRLTEVTAVTGALMAVRRTDFVALGGFAAARYPVLYNDVDFCLRARAAGHGVLFVSDARAVHHESVTLGLRDRDSVWRLERSVEADRFRQDWARRIDHDPLYPQGCDPVEAAFRANQ